jgi:CHAD domain-containing protein
MQMTHVLEREARWDVDEDFTLPPLNDLVSGAAVEQSTAEARSTYYDTADGDLRSRGLVLRRRDSADGTVWQLTMPHDDPVEIRTDAAAPPAELADMLTGMRLGKPLVEVATIRTERSSYRILDPRGKQLRAEVADDRVHASVDHRLLAWRQVELTTAAASSGLPRRLARRMTKAGAQPARSASSLERVAPIADPISPPRSDAERAFTDYANQQIHAIFLGDVGLRRRHDPIHDTRVAIRRLRSTMRVFAKLLDSSKIAGLEDDLKWFAGLLGEVRDRQVQRRRFDEALAAWPPELVLGPVANRIDTDLLKEQLAARKLVAEALDSPRYLDMLATLARWRAHPPTETFAVRTLAERARRAERKADRRLGAAIQLGAGDALHRARKAAKRARYAAELRTPLTKGAKRKVRRYKQIQTILGEHQDSVVAADTLRNMALRAGTTPGENGFTFGLLYAREQQAAQKARTQARELTA